MIILVMVALALAGGTTWLALEQPMARRPALHHRLTEAGLLLCLVVAAGALLAAVPRVM